MSRLFLAAPAVLMLTLCAAPHGARAQASDDRFIEACAQAELASAFQCACIEEEITRQYSGAERTFLETIFTGGAIIAEDDVSALTDDDQQALSDIAGRIGRSCGVTGDQH